MWISENYVHIAMLITYAAYLTIHLKVYPHEAGKETTRPKRLTGESKKPLDDKLLP